MAIAVPRVRDVSQGIEVSLSSYRDFQNPRGVDEVVFKRLINGISTRLIVEEGRPTQPQ